MIKWSYGITTVPSRYDLFLKTLEGLQGTGFVSPRIFVDGECDQENYRRLKLPYTIRSVPLYAFGNWITSLWDLYVTNPLAQRYALFQDDIITVRNLKTYLDRISFPEDGYLNLFSFMRDNEKLLNDSNYGGFLRASQYGRGGLALVFSRDAVVHLLSSKSIAMKPQAANRGIATKKLDGGVVTSLSPIHGQGGTFYEYVHNPSLVQHVGDRSSIGNHNQPKSLSFPGEDFDCLTFLEKLNARLEVNTETKTTR